MREAAQLTGYHPGYLGALCRTGKIACRKSGSTWLTTRKAVGNLPRIPTLRDVGPQKAPAPLAAAAVSP
jgi:hypothetical protein